METTLPVFVQLPFWVTQSGHARALACGTDHRVYVAIASNSETFAVAVPCSRWPDFTLPHGTFPIEANGFSVTIDEANGRRG
jgi:hypothetical protein